MGTCAGFATLRNSMHIVSMHPAAAAVFSSASTRLLLCIAFSCTGFPPLCLAVVDFAERALPSLPLSTAGRLRNFDDLWRHLDSTVPSGSLPDRIDAKLIYMDADGDWMLVTPDGLFDWALFTQNATKILISNC